MSEQKETQNHPFTTELMNNLEIINNKTKYLSDNLIELSETDWIKLHEEITNLKNNFNKKVKKSLKIRRKRQNKIRNKKSKIDANKLNQPNLVSIKKIQPENNSKTKNRTLNSVANNYLKILSSLQRFHHLHGFKDDDFIMQRIETTSVIWRDSIHQHNNETKKNQQNMLLKSWDEALFGTHKHKYYDESHRGHFINARECWDMCLDYTGSAIPLFWVLPNEHPTKEWSKYLIKK